MERTEGIGPARDEEPRGGAGAPVMTWTGGGRALQWSGYRLVDLAGSMTVATGYLIAIVLAASDRSLTGAGFFALTACNIGWVAINHTLFHGTARWARETWLMAGLIVTSLLAQAAVLLGIGLDWLLPLVTITIIAFRYPPWRALAFSSTVWIGTLLILAVLQRNQLAALFSSVVSLSAAYAFVFGFSQVARQQVEQRERAETLVAQLEEAQEQLRAYAKEVEELTVARERNRIAREIHDTLGHYLTILAVQLETATKLELRADPRLRGELAEARRVASECLTEVRRSVAALRPADPTATSFEQALARLVAEFEAIQPETEVVLDVEGPVQALPAEQRVALYRAGQEALTNIRKHAHATKVLLRVRVEPDGAELVALDNGQGSWAGGGHQHGFGLLGMRERIELLGGTARAQPEPGRGWRVEVRLPVPPGVFKHAQSTVSTSVEGVLSSSGAGASTGVEAEP